MMQRILTCSSTLHQNYRDFEWIIDDESYFTLDPSSINGNANFYSSNTLLTLSNIKYSQKILVWVTILSKGTSKPYFPESGNAINHLYTWSIQKRPFIEEYHHLFSGQILHLHI